MPVLALEGVAKSYRTHLSLRKYWILRDLSFEVREGEIFGFIGTNGAGKTTTIKLVLGLLFPDAGRIRLCGEDPSRPEARRRIGFLPENPYFHDYLTGFEFLDFHARLHGFRQPQRRRRVQEMLERVGLQNRADRALRLYSKGMLQRIGLAQALLHDPEVVILDEPMSGLDPIGRREVRDLILDLKKRGRTVFFSTHILSDTETICDRVGMLVRGRLAAIGSVDDLVRGEVGSWDVTLLWPSPQDPPQGQVLSRREDRVLLRVTSQADLHRLVASLNGGGARLVAVSPARRSLEDLLYEEVRGAGGRTPAARGAGGSGAADGAGAGAGDGAGDEDAAGREAAR